MESYVESLKKKYPKYAERFDSISQIHYTQTKVVSEPFFEPISVLDADTRNRRLINIDPDMLNSWVKHLSHSTRLKMLKFESAVLSELNEGRHTSTMVLIRSHMEVAGLAAFSINTLTESAQRGDIEQLSIIIPKTFFGTSLSRETRHDDSVLDSLTYTESTQSTVTSAQLIRAIDLYMNQEETGAIRRYYALLCEWTHPNPRASQEYAKVLEEREDGWIIHYTDFSGLDEVALDMATTLLYDNMRAGHSASELLRLARFEMKGEGFYYKPAPENEFQRIWKQLIHEK